MEDKRKSILDNSTERGVQALQEKIDRENKERDERFLRASKARVNEIERRYKSVLKELSLNRIKAPAGLDYIGNALDKVRLGTGKIDTKKALKLLEKAEFKIANETCPKDIDRASALENNSAECLENN